jgi:hypothetical protein
LKATCHECGEVGHILPHCPQLEKSRDKQTDNKDTSKSDPKDKKSAEKKSNETTFFQSEKTDDKKDGGSGNILMFTNFRFVNNSSSAPMYLRNMILHDIQSMIDLFCNRKLVSRV